MSRTILSMVLAATLALAAPPTAALAAPADPAGEQAKSGKVQIQVMEVYATESHSKVDGRLSSLTRYLSHLKFTGYELLDSHSLQLSASGKSSFSIQGGRKVTIEVLSKDERSVRMRVQITAAKGGKLLDTTARVNRNGTFIVAGPTYKDGILVLPLTARY